MRDAWARLVSGTVNQGLPFCYPRPCHPQPHCQKPDSTHAVSIGPALLDSVFHTVLGMVLGGLMSERERRARHALQAGEENMISQSLGVC